MALLSQFWNPSASGRSVEQPLVTFNRICYGYLQNDWATVIAASVTFCYSVASLIAPGGTQPGSNP